MAGEAAESDEAGRVGAECEQSADAGLAGLVVALVASSLRERKGRAMGGVKGSTCDRARLSATGRVQRNHPASQPHEQRTR